MTNEIREIDKAVAYEIITAMGEDGLSALLTADDLLASMAVPVTQFDFTYIDKRKLNKFMHEVERFVKFSRLRVNSYTKAGLQAKLETLWATNLPEEQKRDENGLWVWEPRPELMEAAEIVLREESFPMVKEV